MEQRINLKTLYPSYGDRRSSPLTPHPQQHHPQHIHPHLRQQHHHHHYHLHHHHILQHPQHPQHQQNLQQQIQSSVPWLLQSPSLHGSQSLPSQTLTLQPSTHPWANVDRHHSPTNDGTTPPLDSYANLLQRLIHASEKCNADLSRTLELKHKRIFPKRYELDLVHSDTAQSVVKKPRWEEISTSHALGALVVVEKHQDPHVHPSRKKSRVGVKDHMAFDSIDCSTRKTCDTDLANPCVKGHNKGRCFVAEVIDVDEKNSAELTDASPEQNSPQNAVTPRLRIVCTNCRNSHLSCDHDRPCQRCKAKNLTCIDAPTLKRGRKARKYCTSNLPPAPTENQTNSITQAIHDESGLNTLKSESDRDKHSSNPHQNLPMQSPIDEPDLSPTLAASSSSLELTMAEIIHKPAAAVDYNLGSDPWGTVAIVPPLQYLPQLSNSISSNMETIGSAREYVKQLRRMADSRMTELHLSTDDFLQEILAEYPSSVLDLLHEHQDGFIPSSQEGANDCGPNKDPSSVRMTESPPSRLTQVPEIALDLPVRDYVRALLQGLTHGSPQRPPAQDDDGGFEETEMIIRMGNPKLDPAEALSIICTRLVESVSSLPKLIKVMPDDVQSKWVNRLLRNVLLFDTRGPHPIKVVPLFCVPVINKSTRFYHCAVKGPECAEDERSFNAITSTMVSCDLIGNYQAFPLMHMSMIMFNIFEKPTQFSIQIFRLLQEFIEDARNLLQLAEYPIQEIRNPTMRTILSEDSN
eukprot:TRINITY_DN12122_c0_g1_i1.p1 TRINITY_DN12122_c0_g1~~TRINITY_DN12122_c0_g1_i1.p1  ORF type:complete len:749 (+),score=161.33 TRINITY_DN12122_c0_g1_i1:44-2290(+)